MLNTLYIVTRYRMIADDDNIYTVLLRILKFRGRRKIYRYLRKRVNIVCERTYPQTVAEKILRHSESLGGIQRFTFQMDNAGLSHKQLMNAIELIGSKVIPIVNG